MSEPLLISLESSSNGDICPIKALPDYRVQSPYFLAHSFSLKMALHSLIAMFPINFQLQWNSLLYKGHSLQIEAATHAAQKGYSENYIQQLGRWNSNALKRYTQIPAFSV